MSWIKKLFTIFQNEDDEFDVWPEQKQAAIQGKKEHNQAKEIETRVLYQYPKGQFRFPLIPDEKNLGEKDKTGRVKNFEQAHGVKPITAEKGPLRMSQAGKPARRSNSKPKVERAARIQEEVRGDSGSSINETMSNPVPASNPGSYKNERMKHRLETRKGGGFKYRHDSKKNARVKPHQPFKPTEIPSPIHAFNRPPARPKPISPNRTGQIEYELTGFERSPGVKDDSLFNRKQEKVHEQGLLPDRRKELEDAQMVESSNDGHPMQEPEFGQDRVETTEVTIKQKYHETGLIGLEEESRDMEGAPNALLIESEVLHDGERENQHKEQTGAEFSLDHENHEEAIQPIGSRPVPEAESKEQHQTRYPVEQNKEITGRPSPEDSVMPENDEETRHQANSEEESGRWQAENKVEAGNEQEIVAAGDAANEAKAKGRGEGTGIPGPEDERQARQVQPRRQLPFNVLMLKQDKKKWEARNMARANTSPGQERMRETLTDHSGNQLSRERQTANNDETTAKGDSGEKQHVQTMVQEETPYAPAEGSIAEKNAGSANLPGVEHRDEYEFPPLDLLNPPVFKEPDPSWLSEQEQMLNETLKNFNVGAKVVNMTQGPSVTRFELKPEPGVKVNKITNLSDDIKLSLAAKDIRIEAPIPGKHTIGIEVPNHSSRPVLLSEILQTGSFLEQKSPLSVALGLDIEGKPIITDLKKMPHGLIAGATGSGKSVCINTMLVSLLYKAHPDDVKLLLIDPKMVELAPYNQIPHLVSPVITDVKAATASLKWAVEEMERRYELFAHSGVRDISRFNELAIKHRRFAEKLPYIVIVIDELADLMMMAPGDVEEAICRIAQKARACGIHLIIATQRPSVDVITGLIKANVPTRIAFSVSSQVDSRTIIDISGAEKLLGRGDMLFLENGSSKPFRLQGTFVTDSEIDDIVAFVRDQREPEYLFEQEELLRKAQVTEEEDELFYEACEFVVVQGGASTSSVQRRFKIGYNRAARLIEMMEQHGFISEGKGSKPRDVLITVSDLESIRETSTFI
ncbi:DNA translocase FtsK [Bacillus sp. REN3]|uniref:DNA translocase FtsK n=1 Tax=Bacillus sp. REN3 TaxID=2802440 RepID=UPI001AED6ED2|nr:DNA translocase FtsK [Bacillus sp. REN3]